MSLLELSSDVSLPDAGYSSAFPLSNSSESEYDVIKSAQYTDPNVNIEILGNTRLVVRLSLSSMKKPSILAGRLDKVYLNDLSLNTNSGLAVISELIDTELSNLIYE